MESMPPWCSATFALCLMLIVMPVAGDAVPEQEGLVVFHAAPPLPQGWQTVVGPVPDDHLINLRLSLRQRNIDQLHRAALSVSDPKSPFYGQYLTGTKVDQLTAPDP